jgi:hypothetical protein
MAAMRHGLVAAVALAVFLAGQGGCTRKAAAPLIERREITPESVSGALTSGNLGRIYGVDVFVYADGRGGIVASDDKPADALPLDDRRVIVLAEGSGDSLESFLFTARLLASSEFVVRSGGAVLLLPVHWSESSNPVIEHINTAGQKKGAAILQDVVRVWHLRHGDDHRAWLSLLGFSAGSRVIQLAFGCQVQAGKTTALDTEVRPEGMNAVRHIVFVGSSLSRHDVLPFDHIRGRFINFVNARDTHFGDRAAYAAPPGAGPVLGHVLSSKSLERSPRFGASANGFFAIPTLTAARQFDVADSTSQSRDAFRKVNVHVPEELVAYGLLGEQISNDDLDDFVNLAPNHYILVGRGPGGATGGLQFSVYRDLAAEFVQRFVAAALVSGRTPDPVLYSRPRSPDPLKLFTKNKSDKAAEPSDEPAGEAETVPDTESPPAEPEAAAPMDSVAQ